LPDGLHPIGPMGIVRYVALVALVLWMGALGARVVDLQRQSWLIACASGATVIVALLVMKFVGPPPRAFRVRIALTALMLAATAFTGVRGETPTLAKVSVALGLILLAWYARE
jgi:4-amino-4-deoxy-L-arabinose transferase-like glycosyltransferase